MYLKASTLGLRFDADPADVEHIFSYPLNDETSLHRQYLSIPVMVYSSASQCCDNTECFRRPSVRALHTGSPRSDHRVTSLASEQQRDQRPDQ